MMHVRSVGKAFCDKKIVLTSLVFHSDEKVFMKLPSTSMRPLRNSTAMARLLNSVRVTVWLWRAFRSAESKEGTADAAL